MVRQMWRRPWPDGGDHAHGVLFSTRTSQHNTTGQEQRRCRRRSLSQRASAATEADTKVPLLTALVAHCLANAKDSLSEECPRPPLAFGPMSTHNGLPMGGQNCFRKSLGGSVSDEASSLSLVYLCQSSVKTFVRLVPASATPRDTAEKPGCSTGPLVPTCSTPWTRPYRTASRGLTAFTYWWQTAEDIVVSWAVSSVSSSSTCSSNSDLSCGSTTSMSTSSGARSPALDDGAETTADGAAGVFTDVAV